MQVTMSAECPDSFALSKQHASCHLTRYTVFSAGLGFCPLLFFAVSFTLGRFSRLWGPCVFLEAESWVPNGLFWLQALYPSCCRSWS